MSPLVGRLARMLDPKERDAVVGDLIECNETELRAAVSLFGLIVRRQAERWTGWRPWLALVFMIGFVGPVLTALSMRTSEILIREGLTYWTVGVFYQSGHNSVNQELASQMVIAVLLFASSWACGFALAASTGRTAWLTIFLSFLVWTVAPLLFLITSHKLDFRPFQLFELQMELVFRTVLFILPFIGASQNGWGRRTLKTGISGPRNC